MKTVLQEEAKKELCERIWKLDASAKAQWGKMNVNQMICHLTDQVRDINGERYVKYEGNPILKFIIRPLLSVLPQWPRAVFPAATGYDQLKKGSPPTSFENDKKILLEKFNALDMNASSLTIPPHPAFGKLSRKQYARIVYKHFDHHLTQFGV